MRKIAKLLAIAAIATSSSAIAATPDWKISERSGSVNILRSGVSKIAISGGTLQAGDVITTGGKSRVVLTRGQEYVVVSPNSRLRISPPKAEGGVFQFFEELGNVLFRIEKKATQHFGVNTPYLAAVVKGTTFSVTVSESGTAVQVTEGAVEVSTPDGGASQLLSPGMIGMVSSDQQYRLSITGTETRTIDSPNAPASQTTEEIPSVDIADSSFEGVISAAVAETPVSLSNLTGGLVTDPSPLAPAVKIAGNDFTAPSFATNGADMINGNKGAPGNGNGNPFGGQQGSSENGNSAETSNGNGNAGNDAGGTNGNNAAGNGQGNAANGNVGGSGAAGNGNGNAGNNAGGTNGNNAAGNGQGNAANGNVGGSGAASNGNESAGNNVGGTNGNNAAGKGQGNAANGNVGGSGAASNGNESAGNNVGGTNGNNASGKGQGNPVNGNVGGSGAASNGNGNAGNNAGGTNGNNAAGNGQGNAVNGNVSGSGAASNGNGNGNTGNNAGGTNGNSAAGNGNGNVGNNAGGNGQGNNANRN